MELTKEYFDDFVSRLKFHNLGVGVDDHCTANPIFIVEKRVRHIGTSLEFDPETLWVDCPEHESEYTDDELKDAIAEYNEENGPTDEFDPDSDDEVTADGETIFKKVGYFDTWEYVCAHFTKEAAQAYIARKKHDYRELRIYVDAQVHCWEFNSIVKGLLDGKITFQG
jgi:nitrite reductase/ring-hydroxylating ferredoxin subunit